LGLHGHGLRIVERPISNFLPIGGTGYLKLGGGLERTQSEFIKFSKRDAETLPAYYAMLDEIGEVLRSLARQTPPNSGDGLPGLMRALRQAVRLASLSPGRKGELLDLFIESARSFLDGWFESEPVKAAFGFDAVVGNYASPDSLGSAYVLLHHTFGEVNGKKGAWGHALGGMGAITQAMAKSCEALGVEILIDAPVRQVLVDGGKAAGVELADGRHIGAGIVASNVNPSLLFQGLVAPTDLPAEFRTRIARYRNGSGTFRMNVALSELPDFTCLPGKAVAERFWATPATACRDPSGRWRLRQSGVERRARDPARSKPAHRDRLGPARPLTWSPSMTDATIADPDDDVGLPNPIASKRCSPPAARAPSPDRQLEDHRRQLFRWPAHHRGRAGCSAAATGSWRRPGWTRCGVGCATRRPTTHRSAPYQALRVPGWMAWCPPARSGGLGGPGSG
jgi:hypothetical protein